jgi:hypothetical protein
VKPKWATRFENYDGSQKMWEPRRTWVGAWVSARLRLGGILAPRWRCGAVDRMPNP